MSDFWMWWASRRVVWELIVLRGVPADTWTVQGFESNLFFVKYFFRIQIIGRTVRTTCQQPIFQIIGCTVRTTCQQPIVQIIGCTVRTTCQQPIVQIVGCTVRTTYQQPIVQIIGCAVRTTCQQPIDPIIKEGSLEDVVYGCPENSSRNYHHTLLNIPKEGRSQLLYCFYGWFIWQMFVVRYTCQLHPFPAYCQ